MLLKAILETEYCDITTSVNGKDTLEILIEAFHNNDPFDIAFLDRNMPEMSGSEVMEYFRKFEQELNIKPLFSISITGDPDMGPKRRSCMIFLYTNHLKKQDVIEAVHLGNSL